MIDGDSHRSLTAPAPGATAMEPYVVLTGAGKSGSKRALAVFDQSPRTHCRCEPNELAGSTFTALPAAQVPCPDGNDALEAHWDDAVGAAAQRMSGRDRQPTPPKHHQKPWARSLRLYRLLKHRTVRRMLGAALPAYRAPDWPYPSWLGNRGALAQATPVLKIALAPAWIPWVLRHRPEARVVSIVRHPGGFLHSHIGRWLAGVDPEENARVNRDRLHRLAEVDPGWAGRVDQIDDMSAVESELWYWRYVYETIHTAGRDSRQYLLVRDEDIVTDPVAAGQRLYRFAGLKWCGRVETYLKQMAAHWQSHSAPWHQLLDNGHVEVVERVLAGSVMQSWWDPGQVVSGFDYVA